VPESTVLVMMRPFGALMESQTGVTGEIVPGGDALSLGNELARDNLQLAVFHGIEFAWARQKHPELRPLVLAVNQQRYLRAHVVVRSDSPIACFADLQDATVAIPDHTREHCHLYMQKQCQQQKSDPRAFFAQITNPGSVEEALDDVVDAEVDGCIIDGVSLDCFKRRKPGRFKRLKVVETSEVFPAAVIAYRPGVLDEAKLKRFHDGMIGANRSILGSQLLTLWRLTGFEEVPADYDQLLTAIVKSYPTPQPEPATPSHVKACKVKASNAK
jgi:ABC-type phosphate/phosphonate transport system substrate-binding protein